jgi:polyribonucleotide nucleotidyltransferase
VKAINKNFKFGQHSISIETGAIARQADGAVLVNMNDTVVLVTAVGKKTAEPGRNFFPLTVNYQEKTFAAGKIPGGFFKREGRPSEKETLTCRLIDRPIRPLFPKEFTNEVQVIATVISLNPEVNPDIPSIIGASAALAISGMPFEAPIGAARVGYINGEYILNPDAENLKESDLDLIVAGTSEAILMVESQAKMLSEEIMLGAVIFGHEQMQIAIQTINELSKEVKKPSWDWSPPPIDKNLVLSIEKAAAKDLTNAYTITDKIERQASILNIKDAICSSYAEKDEPEWSVEQISSALSKLEKRLVRERVLDGKLRIDGRDSETVRPIDVKVGLLPRAHGSAIFTRGETQAIVATTLGTGRDAQIIDAIEGEYKESFIMHYNFPPYCVGETGFIGSPKRREIGHGKLAKRSIQAVMPEEEEFPYVIRVVSEITESNGSSSMASVCGMSLALMDAGVPIKAPVAGVAMGLVKEGDKYAVLTDILGDEDHLGDMDFKVAGTQDGITALQMDIKIQGITREIMDAALIQAKKARLHILEKMNEIISSPRKEMSQWAPTIMTIKIDTEKIRDVIGKGGSVIRALTEETGATIDIDQDGTVKIASVDGISGKEALRRIELITADVEVGKIYDGKVVKLMDFGAFVTILPGKDGLVHISQISNDRVEKVSDKLSEGDNVKVKVLEVDKQGRVRLSMKEVD